MHIQIYIQIHIQTYTSHTNKIKLITLSAIYILLH